MSMSHRGEIAHRVFKSFHSDLDTCKYRLSKAFLSPIIIRVQNLAQKINDYCFVQHDQFPKNATVGIISCYECCGLGIGVCCFCYTHL